jgi:hypothetical protein
VRPRTWSAVLAGLAVGLGNARCARPAAEAPARWTVSKPAEELVADPSLRARIFKALDAARSAGTDPSLSRFHVRAATVIQQAWTAQHRLHRRYRRLAARGKPKQLIVTAVARELTGFLWAALTQ